MEKLKVLIIDDDEVTRKLLEKIIQKEGYDIFEAEGGQTGIDTFKKEKPDIVLSDLRLPDIDGLEVIHTIREQSPSVPIIVITAYNETDTAISALHEGVLDYLKKPIDVNLLAVALGRAKEKIIKQKKMGPFPNLLITDDEVSIRKRLARELEKEGWTVFQASDGEEALQIFQETKMDIVLLDIKMPKKDGLQTLQEMRQLSDDFEALILTGYGDEASAVKAMRNGAINFLKKPIDLEQMIVSVEKAIEKRRIDRALTYRIRELELAQEIITKINADKEIIIDIRNHDKKPAKDFAQNLIDVMPVGLIIADKEMNIRFINKYIQSRVPISQEKMDEKFIKSLETMGIRDLSFSVLTKTIAKLFDAPKGTIESINIGTYSYITLTSLTILFKESRETVVLIMLRGEKN